MLGVLSCRPSAPDEPRVELLIQGEAAVLPDSIVWTSGGARGLALLDPTQQGMRVELPVDRMAPSGMTLLSWKHSIQTSRLEYLPDPNRGARLVSRYINPAAIRVLELYDSLHSVDAYRYPAATPRLLSDLYAGGLLSGDTAFRRFPERVPAGLSAALIDTLALITAAQRGLSIDSLSTHWLLPYGADSARRIFTELAAKRKITGAEFDRLFPVKPLETVRSLALESLGALPDGIFARRTSESSWTIQVPNSFTALQLSPRPVDTAARIYHGDTLLSALRLSFHPQGDTQAVALSVRRDSARIHTLRVEHAPPTPISFELLSETKYPYADSTPELAWRLSCSRALGPVKIQGQLATCAGDTCRRRVTLLLDTTTVSIEASYLDLMQTWTSTAQIVRQRHPLSNDATLAHFGTQTGGTQSGTGTTWKLAMPAEADSAVLEPAPTHFGATVAIDGLLVSRRSIALSPDGDTTLHTVTVTSEDKSAAVEYRLTIEHPVKPIGFLRQNDSLVDVPWNVLEKSVGWKMSGAHALGQVRIDGQSVSPDGAGVYSRPIALSSYGSHPVVIEASYLGGMRVWKDQVALLWQADTAKPAVQRAFGASTRTVPFDTAQATVSWTVQDDALDSVAIHGRRVTSAGSLYSSRIGLVVGLNRIALLARDSSGNIRRDSIEITRLEDAEAPALKIDPLPPEIVGLAQDSIEISCQVSENHRVEKVEIRDGNGVVVALAALVSGTQKKGLHDAKVKLTSGTNHLTVVAIDSTGNASAPWLIKILRDDKAPEVLFKNQPDQPIAWEPAGVFDAEWQLSDNHQIGSVSIDGKTPILAGSLYRLPISYEPGRNVLILSARDLMGNVKIDSFIFETKLHDKRDNNWYRIRRMPDGKIWMGQNLRKSPIQSPTQGYGCYRNDCEANGRWYFWHQAMNLPPVYDTELAGDLLTSPMKGVCPDGWHIPAWGEWSELLVTVAAKEGLPTTVTDGSIPLKTTSGWSSGGFSGLMEYNGTDKYDGFLLPTYSASGKQGSWTGARFWLPADGASASNSAFSVEFVSDAGVMEMDKQPAPPWPMNVIRCVAD